MRKIEKPTLYATVGLPRCGKSTWALSRWEQLRAPIVCPDAIRLAIHGRPFVAAMEPVVWQATKNMVKALFLAGHEAVILDATNTTKIRRKEWISPDWKTVWVVFPIDVKLCLSRLTKKNKILKQVIIKMAKIYQTPTSSEGEISVWCSGR